MGTYLVNYKIVSKDLVVTEMLYWTFEPGKMAVREWTVSNIREDCIGDCAMVLAGFIRTKEEVSITHTNHHFATLTIQGSRGDQVVLRGDQVFIQDRPYNTDELVQIVKEYICWLRLEQVENRKLREKLQHVLRHVDTEISRRSRIMHQLAQSPEHPNTRMKTSSQINALKSVREKIHEDIQHRNVSRGTKF